MKNDDNTFSDKVKKYKELLAGEYTPEDICIEFGINPRLYNILVILDCSPEDALNRFSNDDGFLDRFEDYWEKGKEYGQILPIKVRNEISDKEFKDLLEKYKQKSTKLERLGGPEKEGELFEEILMLEDEIAETLGVVLTKNVTVALQGYADAENSLEDILELASTKDNQVVDWENALEELKRMIAERASFFDICTKLGCGTHMYNFHVLMCYPPEEAIKRLTSDYEYLNQYGVIWESVTPGK